MRHRDTFVSFSGVVLRLRGRASVVSARGVSQRAFSLLEVLLALTIFSVALVSIIEGIAVQIRAEKLAEDTTRAVILCQNILEEVRYSGDFQEETMNGAFEGHDLGFEWEYEMEETDVEGLFKIKVVVSWSDGLARKNHTIETYLAER
ncbi:MAG TPA: prepilin-type N-terminal cleavage/methylation domain-containing protein [Sumerlaeia bacterium]|nr:prepilin-type N-terminal cleavage/methylation domain-containing protein [Sumerlaeia bacterium]